MTLSHCRRRQANHLIITCNTAEMQRHAQMDTHDIKHVMHIYTYWVHGWAHSLMSLEVTHKLLIYGAESLSIIMNDHYCSVYSWTLTHRMAGWEKVWWWRHDCSCDTAALSVCAWRVHRSSCLIFAPQDVQISVANKQTIHDRGKRDCVWKWEDEFKQLN